MADDIETLRGILYAGMINPEEALAALERVEQALQKNADKLAVLMASVEAYQTGKLESERDSLRAKLEKAKDSLEFCKTAFPVLQSMTGKIGLDIGKAKAIEMERDIDATLAELSADAPAQPPQISDAAVDAALDAWYLEENWRDIFTDNVAMENRRAEMAAVILAALEVMEKGK